MPTTPSALQADRHVSDERGGGEVASALVNSTAVRLIAVYALLVLIFGISAHNFLTTDNFLNIGRATSVFGIAALGVCVALVAGSLDVSFGATMSVCSIVAAEKIAAGHPLSYVLVYAICVGAILGAINGVLSTVLRIDSLVITLGTLSIFGGWAYLHTGGSPTNAPSSSFAEMGRGEWLGVPIQVWIMLGIALLLGFVLRFTTFGQRCYAAGDNPRAASIAGIHVGRVRIAALAISGITAAVAGMLIAANAGVANPGTGEAYLLSAIAAVVIGGTSLTGGVGTILGTFVGIAVLGTIDNGLDLLGVSSFWEDAVRGGIVVLALVLDRLRRSAT
ncbi:MAG TPA: ABC transporter permease [Solirubrobacteraceae bacterium]|nr:ABC transporter permease [Solirubrobacteraceae bacterium]